MRRGAAERIAKTTIGPPSGDPAPGGLARFMGRGHAANDNAAPWPRRAARLARQTLFLLALGFLLWRLAIWLL